VSKRKVLGADPLSWIKPTKQEETYKDTKNNEEFGSDLNEINKYETDQAKNTDVPKFQTYEVMLTLRLREDQLEFLARLEREIMKGRSRNNKKERITKNSIIRAMIDTARGVDINLHEIGDEKELVVRFKRAFNPKETSSI
jgi:hypothetical protein